MWTDRDLLLQLGLEDFPVCLRNLSPLLIINWIQHEPLCPCCTFDVPQQCGHLEHSWDRCPTAYPEVEGFESHIHQALPGATLQGELYMTSYSSGYGVRVRMTITYKERVSGGLGSGQEGLACSA